MSASLSSRKAFLTGVAGTALDPEERAFLRDERPAGLILFSRNCESAAQIRALVASFKAAVGSEDTLVLVDQEGGRVQRLKPPLARLLPPAAVFAAFHDTTEAAADAVRLVMRLAADDLRALDIDTDCAPVLDVPVPGAHDIIGNRAYATTPAGVIALGLAAAEGLMAGGVLPVIKHITGHGRACADSHLELPVVTTPAAELAQSDFAPFAALHHLPAAMTAHVVFTALDAERPASTSRLVIEDIVRRRLGFDGLLMSDDLSMRALTGSFAERTRAVLEAGSDLALHCNGDLAEMREVAAASPALAGPAAARFARALAITRSAPVPYDAAAAEAMRARLVGSVA